MEHGLRYTHERAWQPGPPVNQVTAANPDSPSLRTSTCLGREPYDPPALSHVCCLYQSIGGIVTSPLAVISIVHVQDTRYCLARPVHVAPLCQGIGSTRHVHVAFWLSHSHRTIPLIASYHPFAEKRSSR